MAHTPGPWFAFRADSRGRPEEAPIYVIGPAEFHTVAQVQAGNTDDDLPAQTPANAALIAAAPELLEMARLCDRYVEYEIRKSRKARDTEGVRLKTVTLNLIRRTINKATT